MHRDGVPSIFNQGQIVGGQQLLSKRRVWFPVLRQQIHSVRIQIRTWWNFLESYALAFKIQIDGINGVRVLQRGGRSVCINYGPNKVCWSASVWLIFVLISFKFWVNTRQSIFNVLVNIHNCLRERNWQLVQWPPLLLSAWGRKSKHFRHLSHLRWVSSRERLCRKWGRTMGGGSVICCWIVNCVNNASFVSHTEAAKPHRFFSLSPNSKQKAPNHVRCYKWLTCLKWGGCGSAVWRHLCRSPSATEELYFQYLSTYVW